MVSNKINKNAKKPVDTTLGKAPYKPMEKYNDLSHLRRPIETTICGIKQVLSLLETATNEVKNFVMFECDVMYECRICRSIFRSLANFILHKRNYCREQINALDYINNNDTYQENVYMCENRTPSKKDKSLDKVIKKLEQLDCVKQIANNVLTADLSSESSNQKIKDMDDREIKSSNFNEIVLEKIDTNRSGVFQTLVSKSNNEYSATNSNKNKSTKLEVMEIHKLLESDVPVLDPEGKICGFTSNKLHNALIFPKSEFNCVECNHRFSSQKSLNNHIKCVHNPSRIIYICPTCKDTFANPWCVYRHLLKVHRMTNKQVKRMRELVHSSWIRRGDESSIQKKKQSEVHQGEANSENQWIKDIEGDNDFQMCAGCGKHFERKAALNSHSQICATRLELCNNIKENDKKKGAKMSIEKTKLGKTASEKPALTGSSKRKSQSIWSYQRKTKDNLVTGSLESKHVIDIPDTEIKENKNNDILNIIPSILTCEPSSSKSENNCLLNPKIVKIVQPKQGKHEEVLKIIEFMKNKENDKHDILNENFIKFKDTELTKMTKEGYAAPKVNQKISDLTVSNEKTIAGGSIIKIEKGEGDENTNNVNNDIYNIILVRNTHSETTSSEENVQSPSNLSLNSTKSDSSIKSTILPFNDHPRRGSDSFEKGRNADLSLKSEKSFWTKNSHLGTNLLVKSDNFPFSPKLEKSTSINSLDNFEPQSKASSRSGNSVTNTKSDDLSSEENSQQLINSISAIRKSKSVICDNIDGQEDKSDNSLENSHDLLSSKVTFEMFCKKVVKAGKTCNSSKDLEDIKKSTRVLRKKRKLTISEEESSKLNANLLKTADDDVIFLGESFDKSPNSTNTPLELRNGFAGFSNEETSKAVYSIDLLNLSYNNPQKCKQKDDTNDTRSDTCEETALKPKKPKYKSRCHSVDNKITVSKHEKNEFHFILRAAPYMNKAKLMCIPCGLAFQSFNLLLWHMSAHFSWFRFQCSKCSFITFNKYDCMLHARKEHKLKENNAANFILPLPNWKTVLMSHEFRLLKDCNDFKGKHTDENIVTDEIHDNHIKDGDEILESDAVLFGETLKYCEESTGIVRDHEHVKKRNKSGKSIIDIQETIKDSQKLPEPVELAMPADISEVIRTFSFDESSLSPDEAVFPFDNFGDESNDDWGLPKECEYGTPKKSDPMIIIKNDDSEEMIKNGKALKSRPSRVRTKTKQNDDFVYYDSDINNVLKTTDSFKSSLQKYRTESILTLKSKVSGKSVSSIKKK